MSVIDDFFRLTEGTPEEKRVKLREFLFFQNTGGWPCHLGDRRWMLGAPGESTWRLDASFDPLRFATADNYPLGG